MSTKNKLTVRDNYSMFEEKYRPGTINECILPEKDKKVFRRLLKEKDIQHILLHSELPGTGKTTAARALCEELGADYKFYNGSNVTVDVIRNEFPLFASTAPQMGSKIQKKIIILDEFDRRELRASQEILRSFMQQYADRCSIIITGNNIGNIIAPIVERCRTIPFGVPTEAETKKMRAQMFDRVKLICENEGITYDEIALATFVVERTPNLRSITAGIQLYAYQNDNHIDEGILSLSVPGDTQVVDDVIEAIKEKNVSKIMELSHLFASSYASNILILQDKLYKKLENKSIIEMIMITEESNKFYGSLAGCPVVHSRGLFVNLLPLAFKEVL